MKKHEFTGQISDADLRLLRIYKIVVESGGFSAAEVELNISRAAISIAMSDLETRLGFRLCHRGRSGFSLTEEGTQVYEFVLQLLTSLEAFKTQVNSLHSQLKGELSIGITDNLVTMPQMKVTHALTRLKQRGPDVRIQIRMIPPNEIEKGVLDGRLHLGIVPELRALPGLEYRPLYQEKSLLYCGCNHPLFDRTTQNPNDIEQWDAVVPAYALSPKVKAQHHQLKASATATDREGIAFLILTGCYIGYLPDHFAERWVGEGKMRAVSEADYQYFTPYSVITRKGARPNLVLETWLEELEKL